MKSVKNAKPPTKKTESQSFLGLFNVYRRFITNFTDIRAPLNKMPCKDTADAFEIHDETTTAFYKFIEVVISPPILELLHPKIPYSIDTDASNYGIGVI